MFLLIRFNPIAIRPYPHPISKIVISLFIFTYIQYLLFEENKYLQHAYEKLNQISESMKTTKTLQFGKLKIRSLFLNI